MLRQNSAFEPNGKEPNMKRAIVAFLTLIFTAATAVADEKIAATLYKTPGCLCCDWYASILRSNGFDVKVVESRNMTLVRIQQGVPPKLEGCHSTVVGGYVVEGHVPVAMVKRLLSEKPAIKGISLPGMPDGSPGMTGTKKGPFTVFAITNDGEPPSVFGTE